MVRFDANVKEALRWLAYQQRVTVAEVVRQIVADFLRQRPVTPPRPD